MWWYLSLIISCMMMHADDRTFFNEANLLHGQGSYDAALTMYEEIKDKTPAVYYNMGNVAYHLHDYLHAHLYWLRAQQYGNAKIFALSSKNLKQLADYGLIEHHQDQLFMWFWALNKYSALIWWQLVFLIAWYALFFICYQRYRSWLYGALSVALLVLSALLLTVGYYAAKPRVMIIADAIMYNGPNSSYYQLASMTKGRVVAVKKMKQDWVKVVADGNVGWVRQEDVAHI